MYQMCTQLDMTIFSLQIYHEKNILTRNKLFRQKYVETRLFDAFVKPILLYGCKIWGPEILSYEPHFDKSRIAQVHIKFCKEALNTLWCTENTAYRAELGRYPLGIDIKASIWQRLKHTAKNSLLCEAFQFAASYSTFFNILNNGDSIRKYSSGNTLTQQNIEKNQFYQ